MTDNIQKTMRHIRITMAITAAMIITAASCASCRNAKKTSGDTPADSVALAGPEFNADSAYSFVAKQCSFGPRTMNSKAHEECGEWIAGKFEAYGMEVERQRADLKGYDGTVLRSCNIIARYNPEAKKRIIVCAHWDSRPWADNDPDTANWRKPVMGANDGASGIGVMLELARLLRNDSTLRLGIDFVCFDAEDWGTPEWADTPSDNDSWALGAQHWATHLPEGYTAAYGILLDMVGGQGARFHQEGISKSYAQDIVNKVWGAAHSIGYAEYFPMTDGTMVNDDHVPLNEKAGIPTIDIIPYHPECAQSSFGPTWHTVYDDMDHIDANTLKAVGQVMVQVIYTESAE